MATLNTELKSVINDENNKVLLQHTVVQKL